MKSLSSLPNGLLCAYFRNQSEEVRTNIRKSIGLFSSRDCQVSDNQLVTNQRKENLSNTK